MMKKIKKNYKMTIAYDGGGYKGWQRLTNEPGTIQGTIERVLSKIEESPVKISGSGRTDAGVHAKGQVAHAFLKTNEDPELLRQELNRMLPEDIRICLVESVSQSFHSRYSAVSKVYEYRIDQRSRADVFTRKYCYHRPVHLDLDRMRQAADLLTGTHDFGSFTDNKEADSVRTIFSIDMKEENEKLVLAFRGDGFLYHMVRILAGTLLEVGEGIRTPESVLEAFHHRDRSLTGFLAPAHGLCLREVNYK